MEEMTLNLDGTITYNAIGISGNAIAYTGDGWLSNENTATKRTRWLSPTTTAPMPVVSADMDFVVKSLENNIDFTINEVVPTVDAVFKFPIKIKSIRKNPQATASGIGSVYLDILYKNNSITAGSSVITLQSSVIKTLTFNANSGIYITNPTQLTFVKTGGLTHNGTYITGTNRVEGSWADNWTKQLLYPLYARVRKNGTTLGITINGSTLSTATSSNYLFSNDFVLGFTGGGGTYSFYVDIMDDSFNVLKTYTVNVTRPEVYSFPAATEITSTGVDLTYGTSETSITLKNDGTIIRDVGAHPDENPVIARWLNSSNASSLYCRLRVGSYDTNNCELQINNQSVNKNTTSATFPMSSAITILTSIGDSVAGYGEIASYLDIMNAQGTVLKTYLIYQIAYN